TGWYPAGSDFLSRSPYRLVDTRDDRQVAAGRTLEVQVAGKAGVPANASAAALNFTAARADGTGFLTAFPCGKSRPEASTLNFTAGVPIANGGIVELGDGGAV